MAEHTERDRSNDHESSDDEAKHDEPSCAESGNDGDGDGDSDDYGESEDEGSGGNDNSSVGSESGGNELEDGGNQPVTSPALEKCLQDLVTAYNKSAEEMRKALVKLVAAFMKSVPTRRNKEHARKTRNANGARRMFPLWL